MEIASMLMPMVCGCIGYLVRHVNVFGQGSGGTSPTAAPAPTAHPVLDALVSLINERMAQGIAVGSSVKTPTVPPAASPAAPNG